MAISGVQVRMARAALGWSAPELARQAGLSRNTVLTVEAGKDTRSSTLDDIEHALTEAGIEFLDGDAPGIRLKPSKRKAGRGKVGAG